MRNISNTIASILTIATAASAGIYSGPNGTTTNPYDTPISKTDNSIVAWATTVVNYSPAPGVSTSYQNPVSGYGCLGDLSAAQISSSIMPGSITLGFDLGITNGEGKDFAIFENGFTSGNYLFMELAFVQVSSDGINFAQFDAISTNTKAASGSGAFSYWDTTNIYNLAGKHQSGWGTPFDLAELADDQLVLSGLVDLDNIQFVRLVDIPGNGSFTDSLGNPIYDNWLTTGSSGFDFRLSEGIAVVNQVPEPATLLMLGLGSVVALRRKATAGRTRSNI